VTDTLDPITAPLDDTLGTVTDTLDPVTAPLGDTLASAPGRGDIGSPALQPATTPGAFPAEPATEDFGIAGIDGQKFGLVPGGVVSPVRAAGARFDPAATTAGQGALVGAQDLARMLSLSSVWTASASRSLAPAPPPAVPGPGLPSPGAPSGAPSVAPAGWASPSLYAVLVALAALAALQLGRLRLEPIGWRSAAVVALIERPG